MIAASLAPTAHASAEATGAIEGYVVDAETGEPIEGIQINAIDPDAIFAGLGRIEGQTPTSSDSAGYWRIDDVPSGDVTLQTWGDGATYAPTWFRPSDLHEPTVVEVTPGETLTLEDPFALTEGGTVEGTVTNEAGEPITNAWVSLDHIPGGRAGFGEGTTVMTDNAGNYSLSMLPTGCQILGAAQDEFPPSFAWSWSGGGDFREDAIPVLIEPGETTTLDFVLGATAELLIRSEFEVNMEFDLFTQNGLRSSVGGHVDPDGDWTVLGMPTGMYKLQVWSQADPTFYFWSSEDGLVSSFDDGTWIEINEPTGTELVIGPKGDGQPDNDGPPVTPGPQKPDFCQPPADDEPPAAGPGDEDSGDKSPPPSSGGDTDTLPDTGANWVITALGGVALLGAGVALLLVSRRRHSGAAE